MRDLAALAIFAAVIAGIVRLALRTKRLPDEPYREPEDGVQPWDPRTVGYVGPKGYGFSTGGNVPAPSMVSRPEMSAPGTSAEPDLP